MEISAATLAGACALAFVCGFAGHRGSLCAVKAVDQIRLGKRPVLAESFVRAALWAWLAATALDVAMPLQEAHAVRYEISALGILGALAFGIGAAINGGCTLSTLARLAAGEAAKIATVFGFALGAALAGFAFRLRMLPMPQPISSVATTADVRLPFPFVLHALCIVLAVALLFDLRRHLRKPLRRAGWRGALLMRQHRPVFAAALLGASGGTLAWAIGAWSYTSLTRRAGLSAAGWMPPGANFGLLLPLFAMTMAGAVASAVSRGGWRVQRGAPQAWMAALLGGCAMGFGIATVPGGNDELLLVALPALSPHGLPSYALLMLGIAAVLLFKRR